MLPGSLSFLRFVPVKPPTVQTPSQHNSEDAHSDASSHQSTQEELPAITDDTHPTDDPPGTQTP